MKHSKLGSVGFAVGAQKGSSSVFSFLVCTAQYHSIAASVEQKALVNWPLRLASVCISRQLALPTSQHMWKGTLRA